MGSRGREQGFHDVVHRIGHRPVGDVTSIATVHCMSLFPHRPFRFGVQVSHASTAQEWAEIARRSEDAGYDVLTMPDHFTNQLAPVPALMAAADATTTLRIGALVFDNDYKHPVVLAKELATMDLLSDGRTEIGLGAGWMLSDYEQAGMTYDSPKVRIDRFIEGLAVIRGALGPDAFSFSGEHYIITNYNGLPKPVQQPLPPILIGGGGPRVLGFAAREADIVGINGTLTAGVVGPEAISTMTAASVDEKVAIVAKAGAHRLSEIELNIRTFFVKVTDDRAATINAISSMFSVPAELIDTSPFALIGSVDACIEQLVERREKWGFSYTIVGAENIDECAPIVAALRGK
jgi:probable F420-dependent oxidoreductase